MSLLNQCARLMVNPFRLIAFIILIFTLNAPSTRVGATLKSKSYDYHWAASHYEHKMVGKLVDKLTGNHSGYNREVIPPMNCHSEDFDEDGDTSHSVKKCPFIVQLRLFLIRIQAVVENQETLVTTCRLQVGWTDPALRWNPEEFGGVDAIIAPPGSIWAPDLIIANSVDDLGSFSEGKFAFRVTHKGQVWYHPTGRLATRCALDLTYYPYDYQRCSIVVESEIYTSRELVTIIRSDKPDPVTLGMYAENPMWALIDADGFSALYKTGQNTGFSRIHFWLVLKRKPDHFERTFLVPLILLSTLQVLTYLMPMHYIDRVPQATVVMMTAFFLQGYISDSLPRSSDGESFVQTYINLIIGLSVATVFVCAVTSELVEPDQGLHFWGIKSLIKFHRNRRKPQQSIVESFNADSLDEVSIYENQQTARTSARKLKRRKIIAAILNWSGFFLCSAVSTIYPLTVFVILSPRTPPPMPQPSPDGITKSYYAEF